ncbi:hypothetical protein EYR38_008576 [Pleurotus pulmonarius]|nr:hypothetical protein EYR38_008576 [Pleurotus pulmonarius]
MPAIALYRLRADASGIEPEEMELMLPSDAAATFRIDPTLAEYEWRLRYAQGHDCLAEIRRQLLIVSTMYQSKDRLARGQVLNTRSVTLIKNVQSRIDFSANKYRTNWRSLVALSALLNKQDWQLKLQQLNDKDVRGLREGEDASASEGRRTLSWIWMTQRTNDTEMTETMSEGK